MVYSRRVEFWDELGAGAICDAVVWPEQGCVACSCCWVGDCVCGCEGLWGVGVGGGEGDVLGWVPVAGGDAEGEGWAGEELVYFGGYATALVDGEGAVLGEGYVR